jgi:hypothetical protein
MKGGTMIGFDFDGEQTQRLVEGLRMRLYDEIASFLGDHPEVPPALIGLAVGQVFLVHYQLCYGEDFVRAARVTFQLILKNAERPSIYDS